MSTSSSSSPPRSSYSSGDLQKLLGDVITHQTSLADIALLLTAGADPNGEVRQGLRPLHYAAHQNYGACIPLLVRNGADVNATNQVGYTPLHISAEHGYLACSEFLIECGAAVNFDDTDTSLPESARILASLTINPLSLAIEGRHTACVDLLLRSGANPNRRHFLGHEVNLVPLDNISCLELLLRHGADPDAFSRAGLTTLMKACKQQNIDVVKLLLDYGAAVNIQCPPKFDRRMALHVAIQSGSTGIITLLLDHGATTGAPPGYKYSALECAVIAGNSAACRLLLDRGANANETNEDGCTSLQIACATDGLRDQRCIIEALLQYGAKPSYYTDHFSCSSPCLTPLVEYIYCNNCCDPDVVAVLLRYGACVNVTKPTHMFKIRDACGILGNAGRFREHDDVLELLVEAAGQFDKAAIQADSSLSSHQKARLLFACTEPRTLKHLCRMKVRVHIPIPLPDHVNCLPLPMFIKEFLLFPINRSS